MEDHDRRILALLGTDGRMSFTDLGKETGLSTSAVHHRVKRLEKRGLIKGYTATVAHEELGLAMTAFISIRAIDPSQPDDSPERLRGITEIESCWSVAGEESYILKVRVGYAERSRGPAGPGARRGQRLDPDHDRAVHAVREPRRPRPGHLRPDPVPSQRGAAGCASYAACSAAMSNCSRSRPRK